MNIWVIITTSLISNKYNERKYDYIIGIKSILNKFKDPKYKIVIVENNSLLDKKIKIKHTTFLDTFSVPVLYTRSNIFSSQTHNYGIMELIDIHKCINHFGIQDDDFIVKITGRYIINEDNCPFFDIVNNLETKPYEAVVRFDRYTICLEPVLAKTDTCTTGLIGLKCKYIKIIQIPRFDENVSIENKWAESVCQIDDDKIYFLDKIGIYFKPFKLIDTRYWDI